MDASEITPQMKGEMAEEKVFLALEELKKEGGIVNFGQTFAFSRDDQKGTDFMVFMGRGKEIHIQVKSYFLSKTQIKRYRRKGIWCVSAPLNKDISEVKEIILRIIARARQNRR